MTELPFQYKSRGRSKSNSALLNRAGVLSIACFVAASYDTILINAIQRTTVDTAGAVTELKRHLPPHTPLVSFDEGLKRTFEYFRGGLA